MQTIYYQDELNDEFAGDHIQAKTIDGSYRYIRDGFWGKIAHVFWYRIIAIPLAKCYMKLHFHHRIEGREALKKAGNSVRQHLLQLCGLTARHNGHTSNPPTRSTSPPRQRRASR